MFSSRLWQLFLDSFPKILLPGLTATIPLTIISFSLALVIAVVAALVQFANIQGLKQIARFYIWIFRGTPLLVQLFVVFFGLSRVGIVLDPFPAAVIVFSLNEGAYCAETIRAALESVPKGQLEAGLCAGAFLFTDHFPHRAPPGDAYRISAAVQLPDLHGQGYLSGSQHHRNGNVHGNPANRCPYLRAASSVSRSRSDLPDLLHRPDKASGCR